MVEINAKIFHLYELKISSAKLKWHQTKFNIKIKI